MGFSPFFFLKIKFFSSILKCPFGFRHSNRYPTKLCAHKGIFLIFLTFFIFILSKKLDFFFSFFFLKLMFFHQSLNTHLDSVIQIDTQQSFAFIKIPIWIQALK